MRDGILMIRKTTRHARARNGLSEGGFSLLEVLIGASLLAIALLGHTSSIFSEHRLSAEQRARSTAMLAMEQFTERMRSDEDFAGLFERLNNLQELSRRTPAAAYTWLHEMVRGYYEEDLLYTADGTLAMDAYDTLYASWNYTQSTLLVVDDFESTRSGFVSLRDGRRAFAAQTYYDDFVVPAGIRDFHVAVEVPSAPTAEDPTPVLREDVPLSRFGLPADLNGDGVIDDKAHSGDYRTIPVIVTYRWTSATGGAEELRLSTWIWGNR